MLLVFIALLESLPVIIGLLSPRTAYDLLLYTEERVTPFAARRRWPPG
ncbi:hypothetical protein AB0O28_33565 [Microbispora sp. NPDC088329]